jgi:23S rRNA (uracil1939-C5)-methyltransferase
VLDDALRAAAETLRAPGTKPPDGDLHMLLGHDGVVSTSLESGDPIEIEQGLWGRAEEFAQASRAGNDALIAIARAALGKARREGGTNDRVSLLELYAGSGNLTRAFVEDGWTVVASDVVAPTKPLPGIRFELGSARDVALRLTKRKNTVFDAVVLDPPRGGAAEVIDAIVKLAPSTIVYVSCDAATLARDAEALAATGYRPERAWPIDMMPQTSHVEVVMKLVRA